MPKTISKGTKRAKPLEESGSDSETRGKDDFIGFEDTISTGKIPDYVRYVYIMVEGVADIRKINFGLYKSINVFCGEVKSAKFTSRNSLLVETFDRSQLNKLMTMKSIINDLYKVNIEPALNIGTTKGTIYAPELFDTSDLEINELMKQSNQSIIAVERMFKGAQKVKTPLLKLTFGTERLPDEIKIGFINFKINPYYPNPMICKKCKKYGHTTSNCRGNILCGKCAEDHLDELCPNNDLKCSNCGGDHSAYDRQCPTYLKEKSIMKTKVDLNISFPEARKIHQAPSYSSIINQSVEPKLTQNMKNQIVDTVKSTVVELIKDVKNNPSLDKDQALDLLLEKINTKAPGTASPPTQILLKTVNVKTRAGEPLAKSSAGLPKTKQTNSEPIQARAGSSKTTNPTSLKCAKNNPKPNVIQDSPMEH